MPLHLHLLDYFLYGETSLSAANILGVLKFRTFTIHPVSVASDSDSGDVILTRTEPGDVIFTGSENTKDVMITGETSSKLI